jgi:hypothetical protein
MYLMIKLYMGDFNVLSPLAQIIPILKNYVSFLGDQVGDFQVATGGGFWVAIRAHRAVFENLSITERRYLESKVKMEIIKIKHEPDKIYFNSVSFR